MSRFVGVKIWEKGNPSSYYYTNIDINEELTHSRPISVQTPFYSQYGIATKFGKECKYKGTLSACWEDNKFTDSKCDNDYQLGNVSFRRTFIEWLHNGKTKILKLADDFIIPIVVMDDISGKVDYTIADETMNISFTWEQIADLL